MNTVLVHLIIALQGVDQAAHHIVHRAQRSESIPVLALQATDVLCGQGGYLRGTSWAYPAHPLR